ncbi:hypothetical protein M9Y10_044505 [Tritrichomonas musculus]|uniref:Uncharacterized protein n=1 Tax=Tritrichomonas musculus TaxID=1915356 RepID=A0ABR2JSI3_9EUKA
MQQTQINEQQNQIDNLIPRAVPNNQRIDNIITELIALRESLNNENTNSNDDVQTDSQTKLRLFEVNKVARDYVEAQSAENESRPIRRRTNRSFPLNKSKFLNVEQRDQVLEFANQNKELIMNQSMSN